MRLIILIIQLILVSNLNYGQSCDFNFEMSTVLYFPKNLTQNAKQKSITIAKVEKLKNCLSLTKEKSEGYWLSSSIANNYFLLSETDSILNYSLIAFKFDSSSFCKEYIDIHIKSQESDFPFLKHYLDSSNKQELTNIVRYCKGAYLDNENLRLERQKKVNEIELKSYNLNEEYIIQLCKINELDQKERKSKNNLNWEIQNQLDSLNRIKLDELFDQYGFPSKDKVTKEGVNKAFMVLHHSTDCKWNEKWTIRFLNHYEENNLENLFSFYFYRNFNLLDGVCKDNLLFLEKLNKIVDSKQMNKLINFEKWD